jgi:type IV pilus assembly protein PilB
LPMAPAETATADPPENSAPTQPDESVEIAGLTHPRQRRRSAALIGDVVIQLGFATREAVDKAIGLARDEGKRTGQVLVDTGVLTHGQLSRVLAERFGLDHIDLSEFKVDMGAVGLIDIDAARRYLAVPIAFLDSRRVLLAMADPSNLLTLDDITMITGLKASPAVASAEDIRALLNRVRRLDESVQDIDDATEAPDEVLDDVDQEAPAIKLVHSILAQAVELGASDVHMDPENGELHVLFRIDGVMHPAATISNKLARRVVSRIKVMASLNIAERRRPQDGRLAVNVDNRRIDLRVVTLPLAEGEGIVMRVLDAGVVVRSLETLGMLPEEEHRIRSALQRRKGAVLVTGPTGSGKSSTLYAAIGELNTGDSTIITIEDPVESRIAGVKQMPVNAKVGMTFAAGLRTMLRADPDTIMVGEIRDEETAHIAMQAAVTGHLVLSTLHTRDAPSALGRLLDMGVEPFMIASAVDCIVAQRLLRRLCEECKRPIVFPPGVMKGSGLLDARPYEAVGCVRCGGTGYRGRVGVFEVMPMSDRLRRLVMSRGSIDEITAQASADGMRRLREDGLEKVKAGVTSMQELGRVTSLI